MRTSIEILQEEIQNIRWSINEATRLNIEKGVAPKEPWFSGAKAALKSKEGQLQQSLGIEK